MNVSLTSDLESYVRKKVESGLYESASEVVEEALVALQEKDLDERIRSGLKQVDDGKTAALDDDLVSSIVSVVEKRI